jgi:hypothetical protein
MWIVLLVGMVVEPAVALEKANLKYFLLKARVTSQPFIFGVVRDQLFKSCRMAL